jgi:hypothetical protein
MNFQMLGNILENTMQRTNAKWYVTGNCEMMRFSINDC